jgi:hypothetical protein
MLQLEPIVLQQREEEGGQWWHQPRQSVRREEDEVPGLMLASDVAPLFTLHVRPGTYDAISHHRLAREPVVLNREGGSSAAKVVDGGQRSWRKTSAKDEGDGRKRQKNGSMDPYARFHPLFILPCKRQLIGRNASCPHRALRIPRR